MAQMQKHMDSAGICDKNWVSLSNRDMMSPALHARVPAWLCRPNADIGHLLDHVLPYILRQGHLLNLEIVVWVKPG